MKVPWFQRGRTNKKGVDFLLKDFLYMHLETMHPEKTAKDCKNRIILARFRVVKYDPE